MSESPRNPTLTDYMAGIMLANGFVWIWSMILAYFSNRLSQVHPLVLAAVSYLIYILGGIVSSYLICLRASSKRLIVGLKFAGGAWVFSLFMMLSSTTGPTIGMATALLVIYAAGGIAGAYLAVRSELRTESTDQPIEIAE